MRRLSVFPWTRNGQTWYFLHRFVKLDLLLYEFILIYRIFMGKVPQKWGQKFLKSANFCFTEYVVKNNGFRYSCIFPNVHASDHCVHLHSGL